MTPIGEESISHLVVGGEECFPPPGGHQILLVCKVSFSFPFQILRQKRILESLVYEQIIHEYQCASSEPIEDSRCVGSCHQMISEQPVLAVNARGHVSVQHIAIDSGCVFRES